MTLSLHPRRTPPACGAFTLVEVTLALGIVSFALLSLLGLLPIGLISVREAMAQTASSHMVQTVSSDLTMLSSDELDAYLQQSQYFDYDGNRLESTDSDSTYYIVQLSSNAAQYPGSDSLSNLSNHVTRVILTVTLKHGNPTGKRPYYYRSSILLSDLKQ